MAAWKTITPQEAKERMAGVNVTVIDVRTAPEYEDVHIPGALHLANEEIVEAPDVLPDKSAPVLIYCRTGHKARQAAQKLSDLGYTDVAEFGGIYDWPFEKTK